MRWRQAPQGWTAASEPAAISTLSIRREPPAVIIAPMAVCSAQAPTG
jgi:hypothetical protein